MKDNQERPMLGWATMKVHYVGDKCSRYCEFFKAHNGYFECFKFHVEMLKIPRENYNIEVSRCKQCIEDFGGAEDGTGN